MYELLRIKTNINLRKQYRLRIYTFKYYYWLAFYLKSYILLYDFFFFNNSVKKKKKNLYIIMYLPIILYCISIEDVIVKIYKITENGLFKTFFLSNNIL